MKKSTLYPLLVVVAFVMASCTGDLSGLLGNGGSSGGGSNPTDTTRNPNDSGNCHRGDSTHIGDHRGGPHDGHHGHGKPNDNDADDSTATPVDTATIIRHR